MKTLKVSKHIRFVYILFFKCPDCGAPLRRHVHEARKKSEKELREGMYTMQCAACKFRGAFAGSEFVEPISLEIVR